MHHVRSMAVASVVLSTWHAVLRWSTPKLLVGQGFPGAVQAAEKMDLKLHHWKYDNHRALPQKTVEMHPRSKL